VEKSVAPRAPAARARARWSFMDGGIRTGEKRKRRDLLSIALVEILSATSKVGHGLPRI
jgi:hypothetical protein